MDYYEPEDSVYEDTEEWWQEDIETDPFNVEYELSDLALLEKAEKDLKETMSLEERCDSLRLLLETLNDKSYGLYTPKRAIVVELLIKLLQEPLVENIISVPYLHFLVTKIMHHFVSKGNFDCWQCEKWTDLSSALQHYISYALGAANLASNCNLRDSLIFALRTLSWIDMYYQSAGSYDILIPVFALLERKHHEDLDEACLSTLLSFFQTHHVRDQDMDALASAAMRFIRIPRVENQTIAFRLLKDVIQKERHRRYLAQVEGFIPLILGMLENPTIESLNAIPRGYFDFLGAFIQSTRSKDEVESELVPSSVLLFDLGVGERIVEVLNFRTRLVLKTGQLWSQDFPGASTEVRFLLTRMAPSGTLVTQMLDHGIIEALTLMAEAEFPLISLREATGSAIECLAIAFSSASPSCALRMLHFPFFLKNRLREMRKGLYSSGLIKTLLLSAVTTGLHLGSVQDSPDDLNPLIATNPILDYLRVKARPYILSIPNRYWVDTLEAILENVTPAAFKPP